MSELNFIVGHLAGVLEDCWCGGEKRTHTSGVRRVMSVAVVKVKEKHTEEVSFLTLPRAKFIHPPAKSSEVSSQ